MGGTGDLQMELAVLFHKVFYFFWLLFCFPSQSVELLQMLSEFLYVFRSSPSCGKVYQSWLNFQSRLEYLIRGVTSQEFFQHFTFDRSTHSVRLNKISLSTLAFNQA